MKAILWTCDWCGVQKSKDVPHLNNDTGSPEGWSPSFYTQKICDAARARQDGCDMLCPECLKAQCDAVDEAKAWRTEQAKKAKIGKSPFRGGETP